MEILEKMGDDNNSISSPFFEHNFLNSALKLGFRFSDFAELRYIDIMKVMLSNYNEEINKNKSNVRRATQKDIDNFL